jgi:hypothetical protein
MRQFDEAAALDLLTASAKIEELPSGWQGTPCSGRMVGNLESIPMPCFLLLKAGFIWLYGLVIEN